jgi:hypothetical protein
LENPLGLGVTNQWVFVSNLFGSRIDVFDTSGGFIKSVNTSEISKQPLSIIGVIEKRYLVVKNAIIGEAGILVTVLDIESDFGIYNQFKALEETTIEIPGGGQIGKDASVVDDRIIVAGAMSYVMDYYNKEGTIEKKVKRDFSNFFRAGVYDSGERGYAVQFGGLSRLYTVAENYMITNVVWPTSFDDPDKVAEEVFKGEFRELVSKNALDIFNAEGKLLYSIESDGFTPEIGKLKHADKKGFLYTASNIPFPQVRKYKVTIQD